MGGGRRCLRSGSPISETQVHHGRVMVGWDGDRGGGGRECQNI